jgi:hypothetical protein
MSQKTMISEENDPVLWEEVNWKDIERLKKRMKMVVYPLARANSMVLIYH